MKTIAVIISTPPYGHEMSREGLDAILALSSYSEAVSVFFIADGIYQLIENQNAEQMGLKQHTSMYKLFELYDIESCFVLATDLKLRNIELSQLMINVSPLTIAEYHQALSACELKLKF